MPFLIQVTETFPDKSSIERLVRNVDSCNVDAIYSAINVPVKKPRSDKGMVRKAATSEITQAFPTYRG